MTSEHDPAKQSRGTCPRCGVDLDFRFDRRLDQVPAMTISGEWVALEAIPMTVYCPSCPFETKARGEGITIDIKAGKILAGFLRTEKS
jgi:uncharacterized paraquat-inducible protein A